MRAQTVGCHFHQQSHCTAVASVCRYQRQALFGGAYGLTATAVDHPQSALGPVEPLLLRPDYWTNFMWKRTIGRSVYNATSSSPTVRVYAFAGAPPSPFAEPNCASAARQFLLINLSPTDNTSVSFEAGQFSSWTLSPTTNATTGALDPFAPRAMLNNELLPQVVDGGVAPFLEHVPSPAVTATCDGGRCDHVLPPLSVAFVCAGAKDF